MMKTNILGRTGLEVPIVGLGTVFVGGQLEGGPPGTLDEERGVATVEAAMKAGCTLIDTAPLYGNTVSEKIIGQALRANPDLARGVTVTTKVGRSHEGRDYSYDAVMRSVEGSQERLGLDRFEILYVHDAMGIPVKEVTGKDCALGALRKLQDEGVVRFIGTAANDPDANGPFIETGEFDVAVVPDAWSLLNQSANRYIFPAVEKHNVGIALATPIERGLLATGPVDGADYLNRNFTPEILEHAGKIKTVCDDHGVPMVAAALQWCVRHPLVATTIPGARTVEEAIQNTEAGILDLSDAFWADLEPLVKDFYEDGYINPALPRV
jgi:D-threo-aldose 1-dehydrogenase